MTVGGLRRAVLIGLGALAGAVLPGSARAQVPVRDTTARRPTSLPVQHDTLPPRGDSTRARPLPPTRDSVSIPLPARADSMLRNDSIAQGILGQKERRRIDTLKAPLARGEAPPVLEIGDARIYDRSAIYATGALTLSDLLGRVPGLTAYATGWTVAPTAVAVMGDFRRLRIFLDGLELDPMDRREQGRAPVNDLPLQTLEELRIERGADEVRVYARTWRTRNTTPSTRADVLTGDQNTNLYRGWFGRRYSHGELLQVSAEQLSTQPTGSLPSSDTRSYLLRTGIVSGPWSLDVTAIRSDRDLGKWAGQGTVLQSTDTIAPWATHRTTAWLRLGNGDPESPRWAQVVASAHGWQGSASAAAGDTLVAHDSTTYESQYLFTGGMRRGPLRASAAERVRVAQHVTSAVPSVRASLESPLLALSALGEGRGRLDPARAELTGQLRLGSRLTVLGAAAHTGGGNFQRVAGAPPGPALHLGGALTDLPLAPPAYDTGSAAGRYELASSNSARLEAGVHVGDLWLSAGLLRRGPSTLLPAAGLDSAYGRVAAVREEGGASARTAAVRGRLWRIVHVDAWAVAWSDTAGLYRPRYQTREELYLETSLLDRFPRGNFGILASLAHEYRSTSHFATPDDSLRTALGSRRIDFKLEIRIETAVISYQFRNLLQENYAQVPGFFMPRQTQYYGVRWEFFN